MEILIDDMLKMLYWRLRELKDEVGVISDNIFDSFLKVEDDEYDYAHTLSIKHQLLYDAFKSLGNAMESVRKAARL